MLSLFSQYAFIHIHTPVLLIFIKVGRSIQREEMKTESSPTENTSCRWVHKQDGGIRRQIVWGRFFLFLFWSVTSRDERRSKANLCRLIAVTEVPLWTCLAFPAILVVLCRGAACSHCCFCVTTWNKSHCDKPELRNTLLLWNLKHQGWHHHHRHHQPLLWPQKKQNFQSYWHWLPSPSF